MAASFSCGSCESRHSFSPRNAIISARMTVRRHLHAPLAALALALLPHGGALAQAFSSVSSGGAPPPQAEFRTTADAPAASAGARAATASDGFDVADKVVVRKGERRLYLLRQDQVIAEYPVHLGLNPNGPKEYEGDFRTPEGVYTLTQRNPRSEYFLSIQVSYPNFADAVRAKRGRLRPGGLIMIHGEPNVPRKPPEYYSRNDWTNGCIAVSNADMVDIWLRTDSGIPIEIRP